MNENLQSGQRIPFFCELDACSVWDGGDNSSELNCMCFAFRLCKSEQCECEVYTMVSARKFNVLAAVCWNN